MLKKFIAVFSLAALVLFNMPLSGIAANEALPVTSFTFPVTVPPALPSFPAQAYINDDPKATSKLIVGPVETADETKLFDLYFEITNLPATYDNVDVRVYSSPDNVTYTLVGADTINAGNKVFWMGALPGAPARETLLSREDKTIYYQLEIDAIPTQWDTKDVSIKETMVAATAAQFGTTPAATVTNGGKILGDTSGTMLVGLRVSSFTLEGTTFNAGGTDPFTISYTLSDTADTVKVDILDSATPANIVKTLNAAAGALKTGTLEWDGKNNAVPPVLVSDGNYKAELTATKGTVSTVKSSQLPFAVETFWVKTFSLLPINDTNPLDPSKGQNETLTMNYAMSKAATSLQVEIFGKKVPNGADFLVRPKFQATLPADLLSGSFSWDGKYVDGNFHGNNEIVEPGDYKARLTAVLGTGASAKTVTQDIPFKVTYDHADKAVISDFTVNSSLDIAFRTDETAELTVIIFDENGGTIRTFDNFLNDSFDSGSRSLTWNGKDNSGNNVLLNKAYTFEVIARNDYGVSISKETKTITTLDPLSDDNKHIDSVKFDPSGTFKPDEDLELEITYKVKEVKDSDGDEDDLDTVEVWAVKGSTNIEIDSDTNVGKGTYEVTWNGTDEDDEYVEEGDWRIEVRTKYGTDNLKAGDIITIEYDKPQVDDLYLSKSSIDNDQDESLYVLFRTDKDADVDIYILEDGENFDNDESYEEVEEDIETQEDEWTAVEWDGASYDEDDDLEIIVVARNIANEDIYSTDTIDVNVEEDEVASSKINVTNDSMDPPIGEKGDDMSVSYKLEDDAEEVTVSIHSGQNASGSAEITLIDGIAQDGGTHTITWDGRDDDGNSLSNGVYSWKVETKENSTETEKGVFIIGTVGDGSSSSGSDNDNDNGGSIPPNVIVDGGDDDGGEEPTPDEDVCAGFSDVPETSDYCNAIEWAADEEIFVGYSDGTFKPSQTINRVEVLKVILEAMDIDAGGQPSNTLGFNDVILNSWYMPYISTAKSLGIFHGDAGTGTARPADTVNRVEALKFAFEALRVRDSYSTGSCSNPYPDTDGSAWYAPYVCEASQYDLFDLIGANFGPAAGASRGDIALMLYRMDQAGLL